MAAIVFDEGLAPSLGQKYGQTNGKATVTVRLFTAIAAAMDKNTKKVDFTEVGAVMGYAFKTIGNTDFAFAIDTTNHWVIATAVYTWTFTAGAGLTILGWYALNAGATNAVMGETFAAAVVIPPAGGSLQLTINDKFRDCN